MPHQSSYSFRREVNDYQMERVAVGLEPIPEGELVIGILNRIHQARYGHVRLKFLENQRLNVGIFPDSAEVISKEIKDAQAVAYSSAHTGGLASVYLSRTDEHSEKSR